MYSYRLSFIYFFAAILFTSCKPKLPTTSSIRIDMESSIVPLNDDFYGLSVEEAETSALKAELIRNGGFDEGDSIPGWRTIAPYSYIGRSASRPVAANDLYSLMISANPAGADRRGGVAASGYDGIPLRRGKQYSFSFYLRTSSTVTPVPIDIALEDSAGAKLSLPLTVMPTYSWTRHRHNFIATGDALNARLTFSMSESSLFLIDQVSLLPETTWNNRGLRQDVMALVDSIRPSFILWRGDSDYLYKGVTQDLNAQPATDSVRAQQACYADENWLLSDHAFDRIFPAGVRITGLGCTSVNGSTLRAAIAQACFMIRAEGLPHIFRQIAFTPIAGRDNFGSSVSPLIFVEPTGVYVSPTYHLLQMFARNAGDVILPADVTTYARPQVEPAAAGFDIINNSAELLSLSTRKSSAADSTYNYEVAASFRPLADSVAVSLNVTPTLSLCISGSRSLLCRHSGAMVDTLGLEPINLAKDRPFDIRVSCLYDTIRCYINNAPSHHIVNPNLPSLAAIATFDNSSRTILLKVVNATHHAERTSISINGARLRRSAEVVQLKGEPQWQNTPADPLLVAPENFTLSLSRRRNLTYNFPPNSVTVIKLSVN